MSDNNTNKTENITLKSRLEFKLWAKVYASVVANNDSKTAIIRADIAVERFRDRIDSENFTSWIYEK